MARQEIITVATERPVFNFVQCESTLRRLVGGRMVLRRQLERLLEIGQLRNVDLQVLPLSREENSGLGGPFRLLRLKDGTTVGHTEVQLSSRVIANPKRSTSLRCAMGLSERRLSRRRSHWPSSRKCCPQGPRLAFTPAAWTRFVTYASER